MKNNLLLYALFLLWTISMIKILDINQLCLKVKSEYVENTGEFNTYCSKQHFLSQNLETKCTKIVYICL